MEKHLYIDFSNIFFKITYAIEKDLKHMGYGIIRHAITKHILSIVEKFKTDRVYIMCDSKKNWRKKFYEPYKGKRKEARDKHEIDWEQAFDMSQQVKDGFKNNFPFYVLEVPYLEADDIIGYFCKTHTQIDKLIISPDRDFVQLLKYGNLRIYDLIQAKFITSDNPHVSLQQKIIMGDKSDNIPAIQKGLGEVKSLRLIESGDIDKLLEEKTATGEDTDLVKNYKRNTKLIDLTKTPADLIVLLQQQIENYKLSSTKGMYDFFEQNGLLDLMEKVDSINSKIRHLNESVNKSFDATIDTATYKNKFEAMFIN